MAKHLSISIVLHKDNENKEPRGREESEPKYNRGTLQKRESTPPMYNRGTEQTNQSSPMYNRGTLQTRQSSPPRYALGSIDTKQASAPKSQTPDFMTVGDEQEVMGMPEESDTYAFGSRFLPPFYRMPQNNRWQGPDVPGWHKPPRMMGPIMQNDHIARVIDREGPPTITPFNDGTGRSSAQYAKGSKKPPLGSGERFQQLSNKVGSDALAAWIGRRKYGNKKFGQLSANGRK